MTYPTFPKDPAAVLDYTFDWNGAAPGPWLPPGDSIASSSWTVVQGGVTVQSSSFTPTTTTVWLTGGVAGQAYTVTNHIVTSQGRTDERSIEITIVDR